MFVIILVQTARLGMANAADPGKSTFAEERLKQEKILRSTEEKVLGRIVGHYAAFPPN